MRTAAILLLLSASAQAFDFHETFDGHADLSPVGTAGWTLITDTDAPETVSADFSKNDDLNVAKITAANDTTSLFNSTYFYHEHDLGPGETTLSGNFSGQDAGDYLFTTMDPASDYGASTIDLHGAVFSIDHQHNSKVFWFAIILDDGTMWTVDDAIGSPASGTAATSSSDPITGSTEFRRILKISNAPGQRLRLEELPSSLSDAQLTHVRDVGIYCSTSAAGSPSRFDNFRLEGYDLGTAASATISHERTGTIVLDEADPEAFEEYWVTSVPKFSSQTGQLLNVELTLTANWSSAYTFTNDDAGDAGNVNYTPHPYLWLQTRLPDWWSFDAETTLPAQLQSFAAEGGGTAADNASGTVSNTATAPLDQVSKFVGSGSTVLDVEVRDDSLCENLSSTPDAGEFLKSISADFTLTVTYTYVPGEVADGVLFVKGDASGANDGSSWANAFTDFQTAIAAAKPGNEIWVAAGTYHPAPPNGDRAASFTMRGGVSWYGGFDGTEANRDQRDPTAHPTILSGDLNEDDGGGTGVNASWYNMVDNSYQVVSASNLHLPASIDGFALTRGSFSSNFSGSGMSLIFCADIRIANCRFVGNISGSAAGLLSLASHTAVLNCHFENNYAFDGRGGAYAGGDWQNRASSYLLTVHDTTFLSNRATLGAGPGDAGAIWSDFGAPVEVDRCLFENNRAEWRFTYGQFPAGGGAMLIFGQGSRIANSTFRGNRAHVGGAIWLGRDTEIVNCLFVNNEAFRQSVGFYDYGGYAGAIYAPGSAASSTALIDHCTFHANTARNVGGIWGNPGLTISNSILYTNTSTELEATLLDQQLNGDPIILNSCVKGLTMLEDGNVNIDPLFVDQDGPDDILGNADDDLHLNNGSPCIDSGDNALFPVSMPATDFEGGLRFQDDPLGANTGSGAPPITDMGALEFAPGSGTGSGNDLPLASFTHSIGAANEVTFTDTSTDSDGSIVQWIWNFGDGTSSATQSPFHTYTANGTFTATLTVRDDSNGTDISEQVIISVSGLMTGSVSISSPGSQAIVSGIVTITANTTPDIVRVKLYIDGDYANQKDESAPFAIAWDSTTVSDGVHTIELKANDVTDTDEGVFWTTPVAVTVQNTVPPTALESWRETHFTPAELANPALEATLWGLAADADSDGLSNDAEFALGTNPREGSDADGGISSSLVNGPGGPVLYLTFRRRNDVPDLVCQAELCRDLTNWDSGNFETISILDQGNGYELVAVREITNSAPSGSAFGRITIKRSNP